jgi:hypothetical protein
MIREVGLGLIGVRGYTNLLDVLSMDSQRDSRKEQEVVFKNFVGWD